MVNGPVNGKFNRIRRHGVEVFKEGVIEQVGQEKVKKTKSKGE